VEDYGVGGDPQEPIPPEPPPPPFEVDPELKRRITAWAAFFDIPLNPLDSAAVVTAYSDAMGDWGVRVVIHEVNLDDTLPLIALKYYDDPLKWDVIVNFNGMSFSDTIHDGDFLVIPEPLEQPVEVPPREIPTGGTSDYEKGLRDLGGKPSRSG
jgi:nucleoid-associated protein YgaU